MVTFTSTSIYGVDPYALLFYFRGTSGWTKVAGTETPITNAVVPAGTFTMTLGSTAGLSVGSRIIVHRTPNQAWIDWLEMKASFWAPDPDAVDWLPQDYDVEAPRTITAINGNTITLDAPITQAIETQYGGGEVYRYTFSGAVRQSGIERIRLESTFTSPTDENHGWEAVRFYQAEDCWARQVTARYFAFGCVNAWVHSKNITVEDCAMLDQVSRMGGRVTPSIPTGLPPPFSNATMPGRPPRLRHLSPHARPHGLCGFTCGEPHVRHRTAPAVRGRPPV